MPTLDFPRYFERTFPGVILGGGMFYRWPIGLRFALGGEGSDAKIVATAKRRAVNVYESVFAPENDCVIASLDPIAKVAESQFRVSESLVTFAEHINIGVHLGAERIELQMENEWDAPKCVLHWVVQPSRSLRYDSVLEGIANADHGIAPSISSRVYFINLRDDVIFHMYDDRGLDVIATKREALLPLYNAFHGWILDYDRPTIDRCFGNSSS
jgi:hypothetical protein